MKKYIIILFLMNFAFFGCDKAFQDLPRDNPNDQLNDTNLQDGISLQVSKYEIVEDDNDDDVANRNETVYVRLYIRNFGTSDATSVKAKITTVSPHISNLSPAIDVEYDDIREGREVYGNSGVSPTRNQQFTFKFDVLETAPLNEAISFQIEIQDAANHSWNSDITIPIEPTGANIEFSRLFVNEDSNNDNIVNINETAYLQIYLQNTGTSDAINVKAMVSTSSPFITSMSPNVAVLYNSSSTSVNSITPGNERYGYAGTSPSNRYYTTRIEVAPNTPEGTEILFDMDIEDEHGNTWTDQFPVIVQKTGALLEFSRYELADDDNGDDKINPGETVYLKVFIGNTGTSRANEVKATISTSDAAIAQLTPTNQVEYNNGSTSVKYITPGNERYGYYGTSLSNKYYTVQFTVNSNTPIGSELNLNMNIVDKEGNTWSDSFSVLVE